MTVPLIGSCTLTRPLRSPEFPRAVVSGWMGQLLMFIIDTDALYGGSVAVRSLGNIAATAPPAAAAPPPPLLLLLLLSYTRLLGAFRPAWPRPAPSPRLISGPSSCPVPPLYLVSASVWLSALPRLDLYDPSFSSRLWHRPLHFWFRSGLDSCMTALVPVLGRPNSDFGSNSGSGSNSARSQYWLLSQF